MPKIIAIPAKRKGGYQPFADYDALARDVSQLPPGAAVERPVPLGRDPHIYRTSLREAVSARGVPCETAILPGRKVAIWPKAPAENLAND